MLGVSNRSLGGDRLAALTAMPGERQVLAGPAALLAAWWISLEYLSEGNALAIASR